jgi:hypothetical protein
MSDQETLSRDFHGATLTVPGDALFRAWLKQQLTPQNTVEIRIIDTSKTPKIGTVWEGQGGVYAGVMRGENGSDYHMIVPTDPQGVNASIQWGSRGKEEPAAVSEFDGMANTRALISSGNDHPVAKWVAGIKIDGHVDFYLPARRELSLMYANVPELFEKVWHWSSTQYSADGAWGQYFYGGGQYGAGEYYEGRAVAVRRLVF